MRSDVARAAQLPGRAPLLLLALGMMLLQGVWILAVPPFAASDEFDHAYRAASVARGDWRAEPSTATRGTGAVVTVPADIVEAAGPECERLAYTKPADCIGRETSDGTEVATGAGRYHPLFYALVGAPALPFDGTAALYAMRVAGALLCCAVTVAAFAAVRCWARTPWPLVGLLLALSPVVVFSFSMAAPNGLEIAAAAGTWASLAGLLRSPDGRHRTLLLAVGTASTALLVTLRSMGPFWALLILAAVIVATPGGGEALKRLARQRAVLICASLVVLATMASVTWIFSTGSLVIGKLPEPPAISAQEMAVSLAKSVVQWIFQSIGAFPFRNVPAPPAVYVCYLLLVTLLVVAAIISGTRRERIAIGAVITLALLVPFTITVATMDDFGFSWQGRYTIPFSLGFVFLAGVTLDRVRLRAPVRVLALALLLYVVAQTLSPTHVAIAERTKSPGASNGDWLMVSPWLLAVLATVAASVMFWSAATARSATGGEESTLAVGPPAMTAVRPVR